MQAIRKALKRARAIGILLSLALPLGGALLGAGLAIDIPAVWAVGIALLAIGFYGCPCAWTVAYLPTKELARIVSAVEEEHLLTVQEIASQLSMPEQKVRASLDTCFRKRYLIGYKREGDRIVLNENRAPAKRTYSAECPNCGAKFTYTDDDAYCPYCHSPVVR